MQVKINRETLLKGVGRTLGVVDRRGTMPILANFLMQTEANRVRIAATDLEVSFRGFYPAEILEPGAVTIQAHYFFNLIKELPGETLDLSATDRGGMKILAGDSRYQLNGLPSDQFPPVPEIAEQNLVEVESHMVKEMIEKTIFSVSADDLQYHLSSIFWERLEVETGFLLRLISTDGHRLTLIERPLPGSEHLSIEKGILIPRKGMAEVIRFLAEEEKVSLGLSTQSLALRADDHYLFIRLLLDKKFPEYRRIIPETFAYRFAVNRREFHEAIKRISLLSSERFKGVVLKLSSDQMEVSFSNPEVGEGQELVPLFMEAGDPAGLPLEVGFNARYFLEPLNAMESEMAILEFNDKDRPCRLVDQGDPHYFSIIMPMSL
ncbi:MAG: DNA polymerase III subunit beta [Desulfobaccales bacterium]|jgi:DNA polymerase-3 subunit beta